MDGDPYPPCSTCRLRVICTKSRDRTPLAPDVVEPVPRSRRQEIILMVGSVIIFAMPFFMGLGINALAPQTLPPLTEIGPSPTPFFAQVAPRPKYIAEK